MLAFEVTSTQSSHPWIPFPPLEKPRLKQQRPLPSVKIRAFESPPDFFSPFSLKLSPHEQDWIPFADGYAPIGRPWCCAISHLVAQCPRCRELTGSSLVLARPCPHAFLRVHFPPTPSCVHFSRYLLGSISPCLWALCCCFISGARLVGFDVALGCRQPSDDGHIALWARGLF